MKGFQSVLALLLLPLIFNGCSVVMAHKQPDKKDLSLLKTGTPRPLVIEELGTPTWHEVRDNKNVDIFSFVQGYSKGNRIGRVVTHGVLDVFTIGLWEIVGTPIEAIADGTPVKLQIFYDENDEIETRKIFQGQEKINEGLNYSNPAERTDMELPSPED